MSDGRAYDDQGLPWLEAVDDEDGPRGVSAQQDARRAAAGRAGRGDRRRDLFLARPARCRGRRRARTDPGRPGPYKVKPDDPGGLDVAGESETAFATSAGEDPDAALDMNKLPQGVEPPPPEPAAEPRPAPEPKTARPSRPKPAPDAAPGAAGPTIQLGAYASTIKADTAWGMLSAASRRWPRSASRWSAPRQRQGGLPPARRRDRPSRPAPPARAEGGGRKLPGRSSDAGRDLRARRDSSSAPTSGAFFRDARPTGYILFRRNIETASSCAR